VVSERSQQSYVLGVAGVRDDVKLRRFEARHTLSYTPVTMDKANVGLSALNESLPQTSGERLEGRQPSALRQDGDVGGRDRAVSVRVSVTVLIGGTTCRCNVRCGKSGT
jgi:hypothetical protein